LDFQIINNFGAVKVSPPIDPSDLDKKIEELTKKKVDFLKQGEE